MIVEYLGTITCFGRYVGPINHGELYWKYLTRIIEISDLRLVRSIRGDYMEYRHVRTNKMGIRRER